MKRSYSLSLFLLAVLVLVFVIPVYAGGWAVTTLDELPRNVAAGQVVQVGFMVRQHGISPLESQDLMVRVRHFETGEQHLIDVKPEGEKGHYAADLTFSKPGHWRWEIHTGLYPDWQPMPDLEVAAPAGGDASVTSQASSASLASIFSQPSAASAAVVILAGLAGALWLSRRSRWGAAALAVIVLVAGGTYFAAAANSVAAPPASAADQASAQVAFGQNLFLAKGCVVCHVHRGMPVDPNFAIMPDAPDLTLYHNDPDYLTKWLTAPEAVKPGTEMPNLKLSEAEIDALVAFINSSRVK